jgi:hypothetical protein
MPERRFSMTSLRFAIFVVLSFAMEISSSMHPALAQMVIPAAADSPGVSAALSASPPYSCLINRYVDGVTGNDAYQGTRDQPWKTIQNADNWGNNTPVAGECVNVLPGSYALTKTVILHNGGNANAATGYVIYRSVVPRAAHLIAAPEIAGANNGDLLAVWAPYIIIDGFDVDGGDAHTSGHGIDGCVGGGGSSNIAHHFVVINNVVHGMGGSGLSSCSADHIVWRNNVVYGTSSANRYQVSGINVWEPKVIAAGTFKPTAWDNGAFGIEILYNVVHDNVEGPSVPSPHTDGNGIIIDTTFGGSKCPDCGTAYPGRILVMGNVSYNNGGAGISVFLSKDVTIANNTTYNNYLDEANPATLRGELSNGGSSNTTWVNNIAIAVRGSGVRARNSAVVTWPMPGGFQDSATWTRNIVLGDVHADETSKVGADTNMIGVDPKLKDPAGGEFAPLPDSPAIRAGTPDTYLRSGTPNIGAN